MSHAFAFSTVARTVQVRLRSGEDIAHLADLPKPYWLTLSCPVEGLGPRGRAVAEALDTDGDGRVRVAEVLGAVAWLAPRLTSFDCLFADEAGLALPEIAANTPEGAPLAELFGTLVAAGERLAPEAMESAFEGFKAAAENGDGVVPPEAAGSKFAPVGEAVVAVTGGTAGVDGKQGLSAENLAAFAAALDGYKAWRAAQPESALSPALVAAVEQMRGPIEAFFAAAKLVRYNPAAAEARPNPKSTAELAEAPLALEPGTEGALPLADGRLNPFYAAQMAPIVAWAQEPELTEEAWQRLVAEVAPLEAWQAAKPAGADTLAALDEQVLALAAEPAVVEAFTQAIAADAKRAPLAAAYGDLRRLLTLRTGFLRFLRNFVNTEALYPPETGALYQVGTLYLDGRACSLCFPIAQAAAAHAAQAKASQCCLAYCALSRPATGEKRTICAVFTAGSAATLAVGRNGIFYDLEGHDWEATLTTLEANPMSLTEAFFAPWRKVAAAFAGAVRKVFVGKHEAATAALTAQAEGAGKAAAEGAKPATPGGGFAMASVATLGIALSFVATAVTGLMAALTSTPLWKTALVVVGLILAISVPSVILTWLKLRARDLAPILNASGWAVNRRIGLTAALGRYYTQKACYVGKRFVPAPPMTRVSHKALWTALALVAALALAAAGWWFFCPCSPRQQCAAAEEPTCEGDACVARPMEATDNGKQAE